jgi:hypothetical protein
VPFALPPADEAHYHLHSHFHGRTHDSAGPTYTQRLAAFVANKAKILAHNKAEAAGQAAGHTLELNHFADWSRDEFDQVMLPLKWKRDHGFEVQKVSSSALCVPNINTSSAGNPSSHVF